MKEQLVKSDTDPEPGSRRTDISGDAVWKSNESKMKAVSHQYASMVAQHTVWFWFLGGFVPQQKQLRIREHGVSVSVGKQHRKFIEIELRRR